ncbi:MAG: 50S ribosomal protein L17 [Aggregatilineales bacterium]
MRHHVYGKHLGRNTGQRNALRRTMITQLFEHERITTTAAKAKAIRDDAEHMITQAKRGLADGNPARIVHLRRLLNGRLDNPAIARKVFDVLAPRYAERPGGYTRIYKLGPRKGDNAPMVILELVDRGSEEDAGATNIVSRVASAPRGLLSRVRRPRQESAVEAPAEPTPPAEQPGEAASTAS